MSKIDVTAAELRALAGRAREIGTLEAFTDVALQWAGLAEKEIERLTAELETERMRLTACGVVALANTADSAARERDMLPEYRSASLNDVERAVDREIQLRDERDELRDVLLRSGFVPCDAPACNCGSWHHRYGLPERMQEIKDALAEAGHELSNANGNLPINALKALVAERDDNARWRADLADKLHDRETTISAAWEALRSAGVHSEATIDDGIRLLRRQLDECSQMLARQARTIAGLTRPAEEA